MSLVLEALRRVEKSSARPGSVGLAVASYRPVPRRMGALIPLFLGLGAGAVLVLLWAPQSQTSRPPLARVVPEPAARSPLTQPLPSAPAVVAPPSSVPATVPSTVPSAVTATATAPAATEPPPRSRPGLSPGAPSSTISEAPGPLVRPPLILQAISERDSRPVAVINDQLVREGDVFEGARILRIGPESVDVLLENGKESVVRFAPPPPAEPPPPPEGR